MVDVGTGAARTPNLRATLIELREVLRASSVNCWPSVDFDFGARQWPVLRAPAGRLLLQDFQVARTGICSSPRSAAWPAWGARPGSPIRIVTRRSPPRPTYWWSAAARPAWPRPRPLRKAGARTLIVTSGSKFGGALGWRGDAEVGRLIDAATRAGRAPARPARWRSASTIITSCARANRSAKRYRPCRAAPRARGICASGCGRFVRAPSSRRRGAFERPMIFPEQRSARRDARGRSRQVRARLRRGLRAARGDCCEQRLGLSSGRVAARRRGERDRRSSTGALGPISTPTRPRARRGLGNCKCFWSAGIVERVRAAGGARLHRR